MSATVLALPLKLIPGGAHISGVCQEVPWPGLQYQVFLGRPIFLLLWGFPDRAFLVMLDAGFGSLCLTHPSSSSDFIFDRQPVVLLPQVIFIHGVRHLLTDADV